MSQATNSKKFIINHLYFLKKCFIKKLTIKSHIVHLSNSQAPALKIANIASTVKKNIYSHKIIYKSFLLLLWHAWTISDDIFNSFTFLIQKKDMYHNLNYTLLKWIKPLNIIFRMEKIKKKHFSTIWIRYVPRYRRNYVLYRWFALLIKFYFLVFENYLGSFFYFFKELFFNPIAMHKAASFRLKAYKIYLYKLY